MTDVGGPVAFRWLATEIDKRVGASEKRTLLSVSARLGVVPRSQISDAEPRADDLSNYKTCERDDIVINRMSAYQGALGIAKRAGIVSPDYGVLRAGSRADARYLTYVMRSDWFVGEMTQRLRGIGAPGATSVRTPRVNVEDIGDIDVHVPSPEMQRRIADFLDDQVARIDNIIDARGRQIRLLTDERDGVIADTFAVEAPSLPMRRVVERWVDYRGATPTKSSSGVRLVTAKNIRDGAINYVDSEEFIPETEYDEWMRRGLPHIGDVLLTTEAPLGQVAQVVDGDIALAQRVILIRPLAKRIEARWIYWFLRSPQGRHALLIRATGTTAPGIKAERLRGVPMPVPSRDLQLRRLVKADRADETYRSMRALLEKSVVRLVELKRSLITAAVTGEFDVSSADGSRVPVA